MSSFLIKPIIGIINTIKQSLPSCKIFLADVRINFDYLLFIMIPNRKYYRINRRKPEAAFFLYILEKEGFGAEDAIFIDDREENVKGAEKLGIKSILFESADKLEEKMKTLS